MDLVQRLLARNKQNKTKQNWTDLHTFEPVQGTFSPSLGIVQGKKNLHGPNLCLCV